MDEISFRRLVILLVILGLLLLIAQFLFFQPRQVSISQISFLNNQDVISTHGIIKNLKVDTSYLSFELCEYQKCINSILFNPNKSQLKLITLYNLSKDTINFTGKIEVYRENIEFIVYSVK